MAGLGYSLPGTTIEEVTQPQSVNISSSQRTPCFIGVASTTIQVNYEAVIRSSTGTDNLVYSSSGVTSVTQIGTQKGLKDIIAVTDYSLVANKIVLTSAGQVKIASGATYYVSYKYTRAYDGSNLTNVTLNDYRYKTFTNFEDVQADLGDNIPANPLVMIAYLALRVYNVPQIAVVQVYTDDTNGYTNALSLIKERDVQTVCLLNSAANIRSLLVTHVNERSIPDNGKWRMGWTGAPAATVIGDNTNANSIRGIAYNLLNERMVMVNATRAKYYYTDPTTLTETYTTVDGAFIAAACAAYRDSFSYAATNLLNKTVAGLALFTEDFDDYYADNMLTMAGSSSVFLLGLGTSGALVVMDDLTTDNSTVARNNINVITAKDFIAKDVVIQMNRTFKGKLILDRSSFTTTVNAYLATMFSVYKNAGIIESVGTLTATLDATDGTKMHIFYSYVPVYGLKHIEGTFALTL